MGGLGMAAQWEGSVHINMVTALQCAPLTAIMMKQNSSATWDMMTMVAGWVTSALQENAQQEHTEDKIIVLTQPKNHTSTIFKTRSFIKISFWSRLTTSRKNLSKSGFSFHHFLFVFF